MIAKKSNILKGLKNIEDVLDATNCNWEAEQHPLITGGGVNVSSHKALVKNTEQSILGIVGNNYQPVQNSTAFAFMDSLVQKHEAEYEYHTK